MALLRYQGADFANGDCFLYALFDDVTLKMTTVRWQNLTSSPASMTLHGPANFTKVYALTAGTAQTDVDVTADNITMTKTTVFNSKTGQNQTVYGLPSGWSVTFNFG